MTKKRRIRQTKFIVTICAFLILFTAPLSFAQGHSAAAILVAVDEEMLLLEGKIVDKKEEKVEGISFITGKLKGKEVVLARSGIDKVNAAIVTTLIIEHFNPSALIFTGIAGGISPDLYLGDIIVATKTAQHDFGAVTPDGIQNWGTRNAITGGENPIYFPADDTLLSLADISARRVKFENIKIGRIDRTPKAVRGIVVTGDVFVASTPKRLELHNNLQADAVEMEGAAVAQVCWQQNIPCIIIRSLSDTADGRAEKDYDELIEIAARNSAKFVIDIISQLK